MGAVAVVIVLVLFLVVIPWAADGGPMPKLRRRRADKDEDG